MLTLGTWVTEFSSGPSSSSEESLTGGDFFFPFPPFPLLTSWIWDSSSQSFVDDSCLCVPFFPLETNLVSGERQQDESSLELLILLTMFLQPNQFSLTIKSKGWRDAEKRRQLTLFYEPTSVQDHATSVTIMLRSLVHYGNRTILPVNRVQGAGSRDYNGRV